MKFKAVIFDFDGLMFNTEIVWKKYFFKANKKFQLDLTEKDRIETIGGNEQSIRKQLKEKFPNLSVDEYRDWIKERVFNRFFSFGAKPKKGLKNLLNYIKSNDLLSGIASGSRKQTILNMLEKSKIDKRQFSSIVSGDMNITPKPNPDVFLKVCEDLKIKPKEAIVLEDSYNGVIAGKNAGCFTIMIPDTMPANQEMKQTADLILNNLNEVVKFLKNN